MKPFRLSALLMGYASFLIQPLSGASLYETSFESPRAAPFGKIILGGSEWRAEPHHAELTGDYARTGSQCLHILGGKNRQVELVLPAAVETGTLLSFWAERWTRRDPFRLRVDAHTGSGWQEIYVGDNTIKVGRAFLSYISIHLPVKTDRLRFTCTAPPKSGILIDDLVLRKPVPMTIEQYSVTRERRPVFIGERNNPLVHLRIVTRGSLKPKALKRLRFATRGTTRLADLKALRVLSTGRKVSMADAGTFGPDQAPADALVFNGFQELVEGENHFWFSVELHPGASLDRHVDARLTEAVIDGMDPLNLKPDAEPAVPSPIGVAVRVPGQDQSASYRIPGLATTLKGTLIAVFDNRYRGSGDLPGDIDVGMCRSTDGGQSWESMKVIMDMGNDPKFRFDGIGDPSILVDRQHGTLWVAATWSHGNRSWNGSGPGLTPEETGQFMLVKSDDDGVTWSEPINITRQIKDPSWRFVLAGPGKGITLRNGTLVFPAQFRSADESPFKGKPFSTLIWSKDQGKTWTIGKGVRVDTNEAQLIELADGTLMINCRDLRGGSRSIFTTRDLGQTWTPHPTDRKSLPEPVCQASLIRLAHPKHGALLIFSNPAVPQGPRRNMTLKVSNDEGLTWPEQWHHLYDSRPGYGYSCLTPVGDNHVGVFYEGRGEMYFVRFKIDDLLTP